MRNDYLGFSSATLTERLSGNTGTGIITNKVSNIRPF